MKKYISILEKCPLFFGIEGKDILHILSGINARTVAANRGETVIFEGEDAGRIGVVLSGAVDVIREDYYGNRSIIARIAPPQLFAEAVCFAGAKAMPVSVVAAENSDILLIDAQRLKNSDIRLMSNIISILAQKNSVLSEKLAALSKRTTREKLLYYLNAEAKRAGRDSFTIPYNRQELADYLEVERSGLSMEISKLKKEGVIESRKSMFRLIKSAE